MMERESYGLRNSSRPRVLYTIQRGGGYTWSLLIRRGVCVGVGAGGRRGAASKTCQMADITQRHEPWSGRPILDYRRGCDYPSRRGRIGMEGGPRRRGIGSPKPPWDGIERKKPGVRASGRLVIHALVVTGKVAESTPSADNRYAKVQQVNGGAKAREEKSQLAFWFRILSSDVLPVPMLRIQMGTPS